MIKYTPASERSLSLFRTPYEQSLDPTNRWVRMAATDNCDPSVMLTFSSVPTIVGGVYPEGVTTVT